MVGRGSESKSMGKSRKAPQKILLYQKHRKKNRKADQEMRAQAWENAG